MHTPAKTLLISKTRIPASGNLFFVDVVFCSVAVVVSRRIALQRAET